MGDSPAWLWVLCRYMTSSHDSPKQMPVAEGSSAELPKLIRALLLDVAVKLQFLGYQHLDAAESEGTLYMFVNLDD